MRERFETVSSRWFLMEPALFAVYCTHSLRENNGMRVPLRCGKGVIEYNSDICSGLSDVQFEELLMAEVFRILLKHPYERRIEECCELAMSLGSDIVLSDNYEFGHISLENPDRWNMPSGECYEYYTRDIDRKLPQTDAGTLSRIEPQEDKSALWDEDELMVTEINHLVSEISSWGSIPGDMVDKIIASTKARIDYRKTLCGFRQSVLSSRRRLTRMRPNRRTGFDNLGSLHRFRTRLLVAVDVSGSMTCGMLSDIYSMVARFFIYGVEEIDAVQFDTVLGEIQTMSHACREITVRGRGGTDFQPVFDYVVSHGGYDGVIICTDGFAPMPVVRQGMRTKVLWICTDKSTYECHKSWMTRIGRCTYVNLES